MLKLLGILAILSAAYFFGKSASEEITEKLSVTEALISLIRHIETSISTVRMPVNSIFDNYSDKALDKYNYSVTAAKQGLSAANKLIKDVIASEVFDVMEYLAENLGGIDVENQVKLCTYTETRMNAIYERDKLKLADKKKVYRVIPFLVGVSVIILFL